MNIKLYRAKLRTGNITRDEIISDYKGDVTEKQIKEWMQVYKSIDDKEIIVADIREDRYTLISWFDEDVELFRDFIYQAEQDDWFGTYIDDREGFLKDWEDEVYEPSGSLSFNKNDVEIIEELSPKE